jgi:hypothetical protein
LPRSTEELRGLLKKLAIRIRRNVTEGLADLSILPEDETVLVWKVDHFDYGDAGITSFGAHGEQVTRKTWYKSWIKLTEAISKLSDYDIVLRGLKSEFGSDSQIESHLRALTSRLVRELLSNPAFDDDAIDEIITNFSRNLLDEPVRYRVQAAIMGVAIGSEKSSLSPRDGIFLRRPEKGDLEVETSESSYWGTRPLSPQPSAILTIELMARRGREVQDQLEHAISILRLFGIGSVVWSTCQMSSDSVTDTFGSFSMHSGRQTQALETYLLTNDDLSRLQKFWQACEKTMPVGFYDLGQTTTDSLTIAYNRYTDSLLQNGLLERRIANSVMGFEALFLKGAEIQELTYRLTIRIAKFLGLLGYDSHRVRAVLVDAYRVRNLFAHGSQLSKKEKHRIELKYKEVKNLLRETMEYLRISLVASILIGTKKNELVDQLDESLIDGEKEEKIRSMVSQTSEIIQRRPNRDVGR